MAHKLWKELRLTLNLCTFLNLGVVAACITFLLYCNQIEIMRLNLSAITWVILLSAWSYYASAYVMGLFCLFRFICIYLTMRMHKLTIDAYLLSQHSIEINQQDIGHVLYSLLCEFDYTCRELDRFNKFWQFYILAFSFPGFFYIFFSLAFLIFKAPGMYFTDVIICAFLFILSVYMWAKSVLLACRIPSEAKRLYLEMNKVCLLSLPPFIIPKLDICVKRFGGRAIAFDCYHMFYITIEFLYELLMFAGTSFFLILDAILRSMQ